MRIARVQNPSAARVDHCLGTVRDVVGRDDHVTDIAEPEGGAGACGMAPFREERISGPLFLLLWPAGCS